MVDNIKIDVNNFALIKEGEFEVEDILLIEDMQGYAHADILKLLFSVLITYSPEGDFSGNNMVNSQFLDAIQGNNLPFEIRFELNRFLNNDWEDHNISPNYFNDKLDEFKKLLKKYHIKADTSMIELAISKFNEYNEFHMPVFQHFMELEFKKHPLDYYDPFDVHIYIDGEDHFLNYDSSKSDNLNIGFSYNTKKISGNVMYLGPKPIMEFIGGTDNFPYHYEELFSSLTETYVERNLDIDEIENDLEEFVGGSFDIENSDFIFITNDGDIVEVDDVSREVKQLGLILMLIENLGLCEDSIIILDNFDKDMSEEFKLKTSEVLVKLTKLLNLKLIINAYSEEFADAIREFGKDISINSYEAEGSAKDKYTFV